MWVIVVFDIQKCNPFITTYFVFFNAWFVCIQVKPISFSFWRILNIIMLTICTHKVLYPVVSKVTYCFSISLEISHISDWWYAWYLLHPFPFFQQKNPSSHNLVINFVQKMFLHLILWKYWISVTSFIHLWKL